MGYGREVARSILDLGASQFCHCIRRERILLAQYSLAMRHGVHQGRLDMMVRNRPCTCPNLIPNRAGYFTELSQHI
jgi:hypothetical protein